MRNIFLVSAAAAILLGIEVQTASIRDEQPKCDLYWDVQETWQGCHNITRTIYLEDPLGDAENQCRQKEADMACMRDIFASCDNLDAIMQAIGATFSYCKGSTLDTVFSAYLENEFRSIDEECERTIANSNMQCIQQAYEPLLNETLTLSNGLKERYRATTAVFDCIGPLAEMPTVPGCGGESGLRLLMDLLVKMTLFDIIGSVTYNGFMPVLLQQYSNNWTS